MPLDLPAGSVPREQQRNEVAWALIDAHLFSLVCRTLRRRWDTCPPRYDDSNLTPFLLCVRYGTGPDAVWQRNQGCLVIRAISEDDEDYSGAQRNAVAPALPCVVRTGFKRIFGLPSTNLVLDDDPITEDEIGLSAAKLGALGDLRPTRVQILAQLRLQLGFGEFLKGNPDPSLLDHIDEEGEVVNRGYDGTVKGGRQSVQKADVDLFGYACAYAGTLGQPGRGQLEVLCLELE